MDDLVSNKNICQIINSRGLGPLQHNMFNWEVVDNHFVVVDKLVSPSEMAKKTVDKLLEETDDEERREFITTLYNAINVYDGIYLKSMFKPKAFREVANSLLNSRKNDASVWQPVISKLVDASFISGKRIINSRKNDYLTSLHNLLDNFSNKHFFE